MNKRNIAIASALFACMAVLLAWFVPVVKHSTLVGLAYLPAIWLMVLLSGGAHSPSLLAGWVSFLAYTLIYLVAFIVAYAFLLELYWLRRVLHHIDAACHDPASRERGPDAYLEGIGRALVELEERRRKSWFLRRVDILETREFHPVALLAEAIHPLGDERLAEQRSAHRHVAAHALVHLSDRRPVAYLVKRLNKRLIAHVGHEHAGQIMRQLSESARTIESDRQKT